MHKTRLPRKIVREFGDDSISIYHQSSTNHKKASVVFNVYNKLEEKSGKTSADELAEIIDQTTLEDGESILRVEVRYRRSAFSYRTKRTMTTTLDKWDINIETKNSLFADRLIEAIRYERLISEMELIIKLYHLDKRITTKQQLKQLITQQRKNEDYKQNVWKTIEYLNGYRKHEPFSSETTRKHIKFILSLGYHYIYADIKLKPLTVEYALSRLPQRDVEAIRLYKISEAATEYVSHSGTRPSIYDYITDACNEVNNPHTKLDIRFIGHKQPLPITKELLNEVKKALVLKLTTTATNR